MAIDDIADDWLRWSIKGMDGFAGRVVNHARERPLSEDDRKMLASIIDRLQQALAPGEDRR